MNISFYLDIGSLVLGAVLGSIVTLVALFVIAVRKNKATKKVQKMNIEDLFAEEVYEDGTGPNPTPPRDERGIFIKDWK